MRSRKHSVRASLQNRLKKRPKQEEQNLAAFLQKYYKSTTASRVSKARHQKPHTIPKHHSIKDQSSKHTAQKDTSTTSRNDRNQTVVASSS